MKIKRTKTLLISFLAVMIACAGVMPLSVLAQSVNICISESCVDKIIENCCKKQPQSTQNSSQEQPNSSTSGELPSCCFKNICHVVIGLDVTAELVTSTNYPESNLVVVNKVDLSFWQSDILRPPIA